MSYTPTGVIVRGQDVCGACLTPDETRLTVIFINEPGHTCFRCGSPIEPVQRPS